MKKIKKLFLYFRLWLMWKMGYKLPSLRENATAVPGKLYDHFGFVVRAIPKPKHNVNANKGEIPIGCMKCDLFKKKIPCSFNHHMTNGEDICDKHNFQIICQNPGNI